MALVLSGDVQTTPGELSDIFNVIAKDSGSSPDMNIDGSSTPVNFRIEADANKDTFVNEIRFSGQDKGIMFGKFFAINSGLTNGVEVTIKSNDNTRILPLLKNTDDLKHRFSIPVTNFGLDFQASTDDLVAARVFSNPFVLKKQGTFGTDDFIQIKIQDDLTGMDFFQFGALGFFREV